ncbi:MAG: LptF/LptG family permease [Psychroflexus sp.]|nr:LptF/LptG family permease [Psychroflexus sp.]MDR9447700.1 LptF/LptG family permease [Psychroflexus sp.]
MKILDRYILFQFLKTFLAVFSILIFIFILQAIWQFIGDFAGKDIDFLIIIKFLFFYLPFQVPLLLPLAILVASIMTFGNFAENYEFAAMKSAGISLQRAMSSLIIFIVLFAYATFIFSNTIIPWSERKAINLKYNISKTKPSMAIAEDMFNDIGPYNIKVDEKEGEKDEILIDVVIHKKKPKRTGNYTVIKADKGILLTDENSPTLSLKLIDGNYYDEIIPDNFKDRQKRPFVKSSFKEYIINIDLSNLNNNDMSKENLKHPYRMRNISSLREQIDSLSNNYNNAKDRYNRVSKQRNGFLSLTTKNEQTRKGSKTPQSVKSKKNNKTKAGKSAKSENKSSTQSLINKYPGGSIDKKVVKSINEKTKDGQEIDSLAMQDYQKLAGNFKLDKLDSVLLDYPKRNIDQIFSRASSSTSGVYRQVKRQKERFKKRREIILNKAEMQLHDKYALSFACVILFFVGAPLGAIIKKGGIGLPLVLAMLIFLSYHFLGIFAKNSAESGSIPPFIGSWIATLIMFPFSIFISYRAKTDRGFGSFEFLAKPTRWLLSKLKLSKFKTRE